MKNLLFGFSALALMACSSASSAGADPVAYGQVASAISKATESHAVASRSFAHSGDCEKERSRYATEMGTMLDQMEEMSPDMDACMTSMGHGQQAAMGDTCRTMRAELDRHLGAACVSPKAVDQAAEAAAHAGRMKGWANTEQDDAASMGKMMGGSGMMGGTGMMGGACKM